VTRSRWFGAWLVAGLTLVAVMIAPVASGGLRPSQGPPPPCNFGTITNTSQPSLTPSGINIPVLTQLQWMNYGGWSSCGEPITYYQWDFTNGPNDPPNNRLAQGCTNNSANPPDPFCTSIAAGSSITYTTQSSDANTTIYFNVAACNADGCYGSRVQSSNSASIVGGGGGNCAGSAVPAISDFNPAGSTTGQVVYISGSGFTGTCSLTFNGTAASFTFVNDSEIQTTVPSGATQGPIAITNAAGTGTSVIGYNVHGTHTNGTVTMTYVTSGAVPYVNFSNDGGSYTIGLGCSTLSQSISGWKPSGTTAGPGYISLMVRRTNASTTNTTTFVTTPNNAGTVGVLDNDNDGDGGVAGSDIDSDHEPGIGSDLQGVGVFGVHLATSSNSTGIANGNYCTSDISTLNVDSQGYVNFLAGVSSTSYTVPTLVNNEGSVVVNAVIGTPSGQSLFNVKYTIRVKPHVVYQWTTVTSTCGGSCSAYYIKEPKIVATLNADSGTYDGTADYTRVSCWDNTGSWANTLTPPFYSGTISNSPESTQNCQDSSVTTNPHYGPNRMRTLFDYSQQSGGGGQVTPAGCQNNTSTASTLCFVATGAALPNNGGPTSNISTWGGSNTTLGFEGWADSATEVGASWCPGYPSATNCGSCPPNPTFPTQSTLPSDLSEHRFEQVGNFRNPNGLNEREAIMMGWAGGNGPNDCWNLFSPISSSQLAYSVFNAYSFGPGWSDNLVNPS
jgi:hypothetical protein